MSKIRLNFVSAEVRRAKRERHLGTVCCDSFSSVSASLVDDIGKRELGGSFFGSSGISKLEFPFHRSTFILETGKFSSWNGILFRSRHLPQSRGDHFETSKSRTVLSSGWAFLYGPERHGASGRAQNK